MRKLWLTELRDGEIHRAVRWQAVIKTEMCGKASFHPTHCNAHWVQIRLLLD